MKKLNFKKKYLLAMLFMAVILFLMPNMSNATVSATKDVYSNNGNMKFYFTGLELDTTHEYSWGFTSTTVAEIETWYTITDYTETTATVNVLTTTSTMLTIINKSNTAYITIKDATEDTIIVEDYKVDLTIPYLKLTNYTVIENGMKFSAATLGATDYIWLGIEGYYSSTAYYQYEKITDSSIISEYKKIKDEDGDYLELQDSLSTNIPTSNWTEWSWWCGQFSSSLGGYSSSGYPTSTIKAPDEGLYYLWIYVSGNNVKDVYGYILVDNLSSTSSDEDDGNNTNSNGTNTNGTNTNGTNTNSNSNGSSSKGNNNTNSASSSGKNDDTTSSSTLPYTGANFIIVAIVIITLAIVVYNYKKMDYYKDLK